ncbi:hypothetical protein GCM10009789_41720 [Kribbella sancticallisti]|uniref:Secreted protein n=1 Tax=Kribbella sancticallisti TaxID=460087 RepID=A0ABN2DQP8_9ACTN
MLADVAPKVLASWWAWTVVEIAVASTDRPARAAVAVVGALLRSRAREITDTIGRPFVLTVRRVNASADRRVSLELVNAFKRVTGKQASCS